MDNPKIKQLQHEWLEWQEDIKPEDQRRLDRKFMLEFNYNSNHLEGNTLTYGQTKLLFMFGETSGLASFRDYQEMKAHNVGLEMTKREALDKERPLTESFIRELNRTILVENYFKNATTPAGEVTRMEVNVGEYKTRPNSVITSTGEVFEYASPEETPAFMTALISWYNEEEKKGELTPIELASLLHYRYIRIHPFEDGNGRIARLLVNYVLLRHNYPMILIQSADKKTYINILHECDVIVGLSPSDGVNAMSQDITSFTQYLEVQLIYAFELCIKAAKGESIEEKEDFEKQLILLEREAKNKEEYEHNRLRTSREEQIFDIIQGFYFPFVEEIKQSLQPSAKWFSSVNTSTSIQLPDIDPPITHEVKSIEDIKNDREIDIRKTPTILKFWYTLGFPNKDFIHQKDFGMSVGFEIIFEKDSYRLNRIVDRSFRYGEYPDSEDKNHIIEELKEEILNKIKKLM